MLNACPAEDGPGRGQDDPVPAGQRGDGAGGGDQLVRSSAVDIIAVTPWPPSRPALRLRARLAPSKASHLALASLLL